MKSTTRFAIAVIACLATPAGLRAQQLQPQTVHDFACYVQSAEARMEGAKPFLRTESDSALKDQLVRGRKIQTTPANGSNPHRVNGGLIFDWMGFLFIPGTTLDTLVRMLQDYDHRARYFPEILSASKLLCRTGEDRFGFSMRLKEPAVIDTENDVVWERVDGRRWRCRSYSTQVQEVGKDHGYLRRLYSYWRFAEEGPGVYVQAQTITLSGEFGSVARAFGSMMGISPEKSLRRTLASMRESVLKPGAAFPGPPAGLPACREPVPAAVCAPEPEH